MKERKTLPAGSMTLATGRLGGRFLRKHIVPVVRRALPDLSIKVVTVSNSTFGSSVTVSGLISGADVSSAVRKAGGAEGVLVLPPNTVNHEGTMIDDTRPSRLGRELGTKVLVPEEDFLEDKILRACRRVAR